MSGLGTDHLLLLGHVEDRAHHLRRELELRRAARAAMEGHALAGREPRAEVGVVDCPGFREPLLAEVGVECCEGHADDRGQGRDGEDDSGRGVGGGSVSKLVISCICWEPTTPVIGLVTLRADNPPRPKGGGGVEVRGVARRERRREWRGRGWRQLRDGGEGKMRLRVQPSPDRRGGRSGRCNA